MINVAEVDRGSLRYLLYWETLGEITVNYSAALVVLSGATRQRRHKILRRIRDVPRIRLNEYAF